MTRESSNRCKIEHWRVAKVPIDPTESIFQGDMLAWGDGTKQATKLITAASGGQFMGVSETQNPTASHSSTLSDPTLARINVIQAGLFEFISGGSLTFRPYDLVTVGADAQTVTTAGATKANQVGFVDPAVGAAGLVTVAGDPIKIWITVPSIYQTHGGAPAP